MPRTEQPSDEQRWRPRPLLSAVLRFASVLVPAAAGAATAYLYVFNVPMPGGAGIVVWSLGLAVASTIATALAEHLGRRFLPLALLLRLSLAFPDRAPSRFAMARGAGNLRNLERRIRDARARGVDEEPARAAEQILSLVAALSAHDRRTRGHSERVRVFTDLLAGELRLSRDERDRLRWAALLHDLGKLRVPARILNKPGRPDPREWESLKAHPSAGARIAAPLLPWLGSWGAAIEQHHERFDGDGYPRGLEGDSISLAARIVSVADSFEVMTAARSYKKPMSVTAARRELASCAGTQFDPAMVRAFLGISLGRLWWTVGPTSWTSLLPVLGPLQRSGGQLLGAARGAAAAVAVSAGGVLPFFGSSAAAAPPRTPTERSIPHESVPTPGETGTERSHRVPPAGAVDPVPDGGDGDPGGGDPAEGPQPEQPPVDPVTDIVDEGAAEVGHVVDSTTGAVADVVDGTVETVGSVAESGSEVVDEVTGTVGEVVGEAGETVEDLVDGLTDVVGGLGGL